MPKYRRGDVVLAFFPYEDKLETKNRLVVLVDVFDDSSFSCMVTGTDRSSTKKGFFVEKDSEVGKEMGLRKDSFINAERTEIIKNIMIVGAVGTCPIIDELDDLINSII